MLMARPLPRPLESGGGTIRRTGARSSMPEARIRTDSSAELDHTLQPGDSTQAPQVLRQVTRMKSGLFPHSPLAPHFLHLVGRSSKQSLSARLAGDSMT